MSIVTLNVHGMGVDIWKIGVREYSLGSCFGSFGWDGRGVGWGGLGFFYEEKRRLASEV